MMQVMQGRELAEWGKGKAKEYRSLIGGGEIADVIECLADEIERLLPKPKQTSWEGVWGQFDAEKRKNGEGHGQVTE